MSFLKEPHLDTAPKPLRCRLSLWRFRNETPAVLACGQLFDRNNLFSLPKTSFGLASLVMLTLTIGFIGCRHKKAKFLPLLSNPNTDIVENSLGRIVVTPIEHGSFILASRDSIIFVDPISTTAFNQNQIKPDVILITHQHKDHFSQTTIARLATDKTRVIMPPFEYEDKGIIKNIGILKEGQKLDLGKIKIEAFPMYTSNEHHKRGLGNGYIITLNKKRIYISGDSEATVEMKALKKIDIAFICMNLPYTMSAMAAANAVLQFRPKLVYPYHFKDKDGFSDTRGFRNKVLSDVNIDVRLLTWYDKTKNTEKHQEN